MIIKKPKGTNDILSDKISNWHYLEKIISEKMKLYDFQEIRTPIFEYTELFLKSIADTDDIVQKEMYTFFDKGNRSITLRPEYTASIARSFVENSLFKKILPLKYYYLGEIFRYANPQEGRYRQFNQFGVEVLGSKKPYVDADIIYLCLNLLESFGLKKLKILINSVGCNFCRKKYKKILINYLKKYSDNFCYLCKDRFFKNPLRIFDCKNIICNKITDNAPYISDYLCEECNNHFKEVLNYLNILNVKYIIDKKMVRGLDYYTKTAFEIIIEGNNKMQNSIAGGGRYDYLIELLKGPETPAIGFAIGLERVLIALEKQNFNYSDSFKNNKILIAILDIKYYKHVFSLLKTFRKNNITVITDVMDRSLRSQFKYANKINVSYVITLGSNEIKNKTYPFKNMITGEEKKDLKLSEIINILKNERKN